ncbi:hypothetical protein Tco_1009411 [Tanacetum coccineum]
MANIRSCNKHNMIACVEKTAQNADFYQVIDFLTGCSINYSLLVDPDLIGPWLQQFWATATLQVINDVPHIRAKVAGKKILISEATIRADLLFDDENGVDCFPKQVIWDVLKDIGYEVLRALHGNNLGQTLPPSALVVRDARRHSNSKCLLILKVLLIPQSAAQSQSSSAHISTTCFHYTRTASFHDTKLTLKGRAELQRTADFQSQNHALWLEIQNLQIKRERSKRHKKESASSVKLGRNQDKGSLSEEHKKKCCDEEVNIEGERTSNVKSGDTEEFGFGDNLKTQEVEHSWSHTNTSSPANSSADPKDRGKGITASKKPKLRTETIDELRNYLRVVDLKECTSKESLGRNLHYYRAPSIDSPDGDYLYFTESNNHFRAFDTVMGDTHVLDRQDLITYIELIKRMGNHKWRFLESSDCHTLDIEDGTMIQCLLREDILYPRKIDDKDAGTWNGN